MLPFLDRTPKRLRRSERVPIRCALMPVKQGASPSASSAIIADSAPAELRGTAFADQPSTDGGQRLPSTLGWLTRRRSCQVCSPSPCSSRNREYPCLSGEPARCSSHRIISVTQRRFSSSSPWLLGVVRAEPLIRMSTGARLTRCHRLSAMSRNRCPPYAVICSSSAIAMTLHTCAAHVHAKSGLVP